MAAVTAVFGAAVVGGGSVVGGAVGAGAVAVFGAVVWRWFARGGGGERRQL